MENVQFPPQLLPSSRKGKQWKISCVDFADSKLHFNYSLIRKNLINLRINYDLMAGKLHMQDLQLLCNPDNLLAEFIPNNIQHYPIINAKLNVLKGEEAKRLFDCRVVITNPTAISEIEENKRDAVYQMLQLMFQDESASEEEFLQRLEAANDYFTYEWLDIREIRANCLLNHYMKEYNIPLLFNRGFSDAMIVGEELYQCDIVGGEPILERLNPLKVRIFKSGYSNRVEDADMIVLEDYWSIGKVYDYYYDVLTKKDIEYLENHDDYFSKGSTDTMGNVDERQGFVSLNMISDIISDSTMYFDPFGKYADAVSDDLLPFDNFGNVRIIRVYWKSRRKIKKVKFFTEDGEEDFTFMPENYSINEYKGEEEEAFWVNEAWEGTKIGEKIYVNIRPRPILYNRISNPSRCHFGIIGSIYNINDDKPFSMVDMMKPFNYLYDVIHDRLNKMMARNWGKMTRLDLAKKPNSWKMDKWLYYAKTMGLFIEDSFNPGNYGPAIGKVAGAMNSNTQGVIDADFGNNILQYINLLEYIKQEMADVAGISKQREGLISNRETVGGVERATLLSSHITEWLFFTHDDVKKRVLEAFLETAKIAMKGRNKKFQYVLSDSSLKVMDVDGDLFAECDYGLVVDNSNSLQELNSKLESLAQAALQNQALSFSTIMKLFGTASLAEKLRFIENDERQMKEAQQQQLQQEMQMQQLLQLAMLLQKQMEMLQKDALNKRDNETKITVAEINSQAEMAILQIKNHMTEEDKMLEDGVAPEEYSQEARERLMEEMRLFDAKLLLDRDKLQWEKDKNRYDNDVKKELNRELLKSREAIAKEQARTRTFKSTTK